MKKHIKRNIKRIKKHIENVKDLAVFKKPIFNVALFVMGIIAIIFLYKNPWGGFTLTDYQNAAYAVGDYHIKLTNGYAELVPTTSLKVIFENFGKESTADINGDGEPDKAFILTQRGGRSGTYFYIVAAIKSKKGYTGTNVVLLGDRIIPESTEIKDKKIIVKILDRKKGEPMSTAPTIEQTRYFILKKGSLVETL